MHAAFAAQTGIRAGAPLTVVAGCRVGRVRTTGRRVTGIVCADIAVIAGFCRTLTCARRTRIVLRTSVAVIAWIGIVRMLTTVGRTAAVIGAGIAVVAGSGRWSIGATGICITAVLSAGNAVIAVQSVVSTAIKSVAAVYRACVAVVAIRRRTILTTAYRVTGLHAVTRIVVITDRRCAGFAS
jgi:hypothetical protein